MIEDLNNEQIKTIEHVYDIVKNGAKSIDIHIRKDGKDYYFEADWIRNILIDIRMHAILNGQKPLDGKAAEILNDNLTDIYL